MYVPRLHKVESFILWKNRVDGNNQASIYQGLECFRFDTVGGRIELFYNHPQKVFVREDKSRIFLIKGSLIPEQENLQYLDDAYTRSGDTIFSQIEGSFALIIIDVPKRLILAGTDRLNSFKLFTGKLGESRFISGSMYSLPIMNVSLDIESVYHYLINGAVLENRTLFREVEIIPQASYLKISPTGESFMPYWEPQFNSDTPGGHPNTYQEELKDLLRNSVIKRFQRKNDLIISLSGGYDASALLGLLGENGFNDRLNAVSYFHGRVMGNGDASVARRQAEKVKVRFNAMEAFSGSIKETILQNAIRGQGLAPFCNEIGFWINLEEIIKPNSILVTGEEYFGWAVSNHSQKVDAFHNLGFKDSRSLASLKKFIPAEIQDTFSRLDKVIKPRMLESVKEADNLFDYKSLLYFKQSLPHILLAWREFYAYPWLSPVTPFLDKDMLAFIFRLPVDYRLNKSLFKETVMQMYPEIFHFRRASVNNNLPSWPNILTQSMFQVEELLDQPSDLDQLFPAENILKLLRYRNKGLLMRKMEFSNLLTKSGKKIPLITSLQRRILPADQIGWESYVLRLLTLRQFLIYYNSRNE